MFAKIDVNGDGAAELYTMLKAAKPHDDGSVDVRWNFEKFLVDGEGRVLARWDTGTTPEQIREQLPEYM